MEMFPVRIGDIDLAFEIPFRVLGTVDMCCEEKLFAIGGVVGAVIVVEAIGHGVRRRAGYRRLYEPLVEDHIRIDFHLVLEIQCVDHFGFFVGHIRVKPGADLIPIAIGIW